MKNEDLLNLKINIRTKDNLAFQEMAFLLDKPGFLKILPDLRKTYKVRELISLDKYFGGTDYFRADKDSKVKINLKKYKRLNEFKEKFPEQYEFAADGIPDATGKLIFECNFICFEFKRPIFFAEIVSQAIFCGAVDGRFYKPTEAKVLDLEEMGGIELSLPQPAILVSPTSRYEDVKSCFRKARKLVKTDKRLSYYQPKIDTAPNIRKYRHWYWERLKGKTYKNIADDWFEEHEEENTIEVDVIKGVKYYTENLTE